MPIHLKYVQLTNYRSFVGNVSIGPFLKFTVLIGSNQLGQCDLLDAIDFVLCVFNPHGGPISAAGVDSPCSVAVIVETSFAQSSCLTFKRHWIRPDDDAAAAGEYEIDGQSVTVADYLAKLQTIRIDANSAPVVLEPRTLRDIFNNDRHELRDLFERICDSVNSANACRALHTRETDLREQIRQQFVQMGSVHRKQLTLRKQTIELRQLQEQMKLTKDLRRLVKMWMLEQQIVANADQRKAADRTYADIHNRIRLSQRNLTAANAEVAKIRDSTVAEADVANESPASTNGDGRIDSADDESKLIMQEKCLKMHKQLLGFIDERLEPQHDENATTEQLDCIQLMHQQLDASDAAFNELVASLPDDPFATTATQQREANNLHVALNARLDAIQAESNGSISKFETARRAMADKHKTDMRQLRQRTYNDWAEAIRSRDEQRRQSMEMLRRHQTAGAVKHVTDVLVAQPQRGQPDCQAAVAVAAHDLMGAVICETDEQAAECQRLLLANGGDGGIDKVLVLNGVDQPLSDRWMEGRRMPANVHHMDDLIRSKRNCKDMGVDTYLANNVGAVLCGNQQLARELATSGDVADATNAISLDGWMFGRDGSVTVVANAERMATNVRTSDRFLRLHELADDDVDGNRFTVVDVTNDSPTSNEATVTTEITKQVDDFRLQWKMCAAAANCAGVDDIDVRDGLAEARRSQTDAIATVQGLVDGLSRKCAKVHAEETMIRESKMAEQFASSLVDLNEQKTNNANRIAELRTEHERLHQGRLEMLLKLKKKNVRVDLLAGSLDTLRDNDPTSMEAIHIDYAVIDDLITNDKAAASFEQLCEQQSQAAEQLLRVEQRKTLPETYKRAAAERVALELTQQQTKDELDATLSSLNDAMSERVRRFGPFLEYMRDYVATSFGRMQVLAHLFPERCEAQADQLDVYEALENGVFIDFNENGRRRLGKWSPIEQALFAMNLMFGAYEYTRQPFVLVSQLDDLLDTGGHRTAAQWTGMLSRLLMDRCAEGGQVVLATNRRELIDVADNVIGVLLMDNFESKPVLLDDDCVDD